MSGPVERVVAIMESLSADQREGLTAQDVVEKSGLPASTGYRILTELQDLGLVHKLGKRKLAPNFSFARRISHPGVNPDMLAEACATMSDQLTSASEIVLLRGQSMLWHLVHQHDAQAIRLRAHPGYTRDAYELDSIGRLALAHTSLAHIEQAWDTSAFYSTGLDRASMGWPEVRALIESIDPAGMQYDMLGNAKGIRRFCVAVRDAHGQMACLLTVAEAAIPVRNEAAHAETIRQILIQQRARIEDGANDAEAPQRRSGASAQH